MTFSEHAEKKMWDLLKDYDTQVGSRRNQPDGEGKTKTDCITYVRQVLEYAFEQSGSTAYRDGVRKHFEKGTELASYLVSGGPNWSAYYWNPDVAHPKDGQGEHPFSYKEAKRTNQYYKVPIKGMIINYRLTNPGTNDMAAFNRFGAVKVAFGLAKGGMHTFLCSYGMIFEVHWTGIGGDPLGLTPGGVYQRSPFYSFEWLSGLMVVPPDAGFSL